MDFGSLFMGLWCGGVFLFGVWWGRKSVRKELEKNAIPGYMEDGIVTLGVDQRAVPFGGEEKTAVYIIQADEQ